MNTIFDLIKGKTEKKKCKVCQEWKIRDEFYKHTSNSDGLHGRCKRCHSDIIRVNYAKNSEKKKEYQKEYFKKKMDDPKFKKYRSKKARKYYSLHNQPQFSKSRKLIHDEIIEKSGYIHCERCKLSGSTLYDTHHIIYRSEAPKHQNLDRKENLICLCRSCHKWFHLNKSNRDEIVKERELYKLFPELLYLK